MVNKFSENSKEDLTMITKHSLVRLDNPATLKEKHGIKYMEKLLTTRISEKKISGIFTLWLL